MIRQISNSCYGGQTGTIVYTSSSSFSGIPFISVRKYHVPRLHVILIIEMFSALSRFVFINPLLVITGSEIACVRVVVKCGVL